MSETDREYVKDAEVEITSVEAAVDSKTETVSRVVFETSKGRITYKPKVEKANYIEGIKMVQNVPCNPMELSESIREVGRAINSRGTIKVIVTYQVWTTEKDGEPVTYRYVNGRKMMDSWKVIKEETKAETVKQ